MSLSRAGEAWVDCTMSSMSGSSHFYRLVQQGKMESALRIARKIDDPGDRAKALAWVARYTKDDVVEIAREAAQAAKGGTDGFQRSIVRAWEIAALAERGKHRAARIAVEEAVHQTRWASPPGSRAVALSMILQAAVRIDEQAAAVVVKEINAALGDETYWRCKRAVKEARQIMSGEYPPRTFFWR